MDENEYPTIQDLRDRLSDLIDQGLGELPVQVLVVPDSTLQAIARASGQKDDAKPALMIDLTDDDGNAVTVVSTDRMGDTSPRVAVQ